MKVGFVAVAVVLTLLGFAIAGAVVFAAHSSMPDKYRFTGWMAPSANASPRHVTFDGDAPVRRRASLLGRAPCPREAHQPQGPLRPAPYPPAKSSDLRTQSAPFR